MKRRLLWCAGDRDAAVSWLTGHLSPQMRGDVLWLGAQPPDGVDRLEPRRIATRLGSDLGLLVVDAHGGFHPDVFAAALGTLRGGGDCVILTPEPGAWVAGPDPDQARFAAYPLDAAAMRPLFLERLVRLWRRDSAVLACRPGGDTVPVCAPRAPDEIVLNADQRAAVEAAQRVALGHARRPLVIVADRGRGKSTVLGVAAARLLQAGYPRVTVVAPHANAVQTLWRHALGGSADTPAVIADIRIGAGELRFRTAQQWLKETDHRGLLLIDEAAALTLPVLAGVVDHANRLVFATTVHGYEGSGRGFVLRFLALLDRHMPQWRRAELVSPVRWSADDPLEGLLNRGLLLDAEPGGLDGPAAEIGYRRVDAAALAADEPLLRQVFGLLIAAHYQTRPSDLRQLLDNPLLSIHVAEAAGSVIGVALGSAEGGLDQEISAAIRAGRRRPRGHLLPQALAVHADVGRLLSERVLRVQRIAVHPDHRRRGIGSGLLAQLAEAATAEGVGWLGSVYGVEPALLAFWVGAGFAPVHVSRRTDPASGAHSLFMLRGLDAQGIAACAEMAGRFRRGLPSALAGSLRGLDAAVAAALLAGRDCGDLAIAAERPVLERIALGQRPVEGADYAVYCGLLERCAGGRVPALALAPLVARWLQHAPPSDVCRRFGLASPKALDKALVDLFAGMMSGQRAGG